MFVWIQRNKPGENALPVEAKALWAAQGPSGTSITGRPWESWSFSGRTWASPRVGLGEYVSWDCLFVLTCLQCCFHFSSCCIQHKQFTHSVMRKKWKTHLTSEFHVVGRRASAEMGGRRPKEAGGRRAGARGTRPHLPGDDPTPAARNCPRMRLCSLSARARRSS